MRGSIPRAARLAFLVLLACSSTARASWVEERCGGPVDDAEVRYTLELVDPEAPLVSVRVEAPGDSDGESEFALADGWGGLAETGNDLELVEARAQDELVDHERPSPHVWRLRHAPGAPLILTFELGATTHRASPPPEYYLPILERGLLHAIGSQTLPAPEHLDGGAARPLQLTWLGFEEAGWRTVTSFGAGLEIRTRIPLDEFRHALFLAGDLRLERRELHGQDLCIALHGVWKFSDTAFADLGARIVALGRDFFEDHEQPFYLVSLIAAGDAGQRGTSYGGTGLSDSFALFLTPTMTLAPMAGGGGIAWLLAHELFHEWNGQAITLAQPEQLGYWFSEGFTDFYARRLLYRTGFLDEAGYIESWNHKLAAQAANPERHASAERVREAFWSDRQVGEVPYQRGDLIALQVDHAIRTRSQGRQSLDDLMRALVARSRAGGGPLSNEDLVAAVGERAGPEVAASVRLWAVEGVEPPLPADAAGSGFELVPVELPTFDTGFDHEATLRDGVVRGVRTGGCAERAGLCDGMAFVSWSVNLGQVAQPIEVGVRENGAVRRLTYLPHGAPVSGYRLQTRDG